MLLFNKMIKNYIEIKFWEIAKWLIRRGYGADCPDYDPNCASCEAKKMIRWIDRHIDLISS